MGTEPSAGARAVHEDADVSGEADRFLLSVSPEPTSGCWLWTGAAAGGGRYGAFYLGGRTDYAHRAAWRILRGSIPTGLHVLHRVALLDALAASGLYPPERGAVAEELLREKLREIELAKRRSA